MIKMFKSKKNSFKVNTSILTVILLTLSFTLLATSFMISKCRQLQMSETQKFESTVNEWIDKKFAELSTIAKLITTYDYTYENTAEIKNLLFSMIEKNEPDELIDYYIVFPDNQTVFAKEWPSLDDYYFTEQSYYKEAVRTKMQYVTPMYIDKHTGKMIITISQPIYKNGSLFGVIAADFLTDKLGSIFSVLSSNGISATLLDRNYNVVLHNNIQYISNVENGLVNYKTAGISDKLVDAKKYNAIFGADLNIHSSIYSSEYGYTVIVTTDGIHYFGSNIIFILICLVICIILLIYTIKETKKKAEEQLEALRQANKVADTDYLTGIPNRRAGERSVEDIIERQECGMFCLFDVDKFKSINDNFGHLAGDKVLISVSEALQKTIRKSDIIMRLGGDEFAIFAKDIISKENADRFFERLFTNIRNYDVPELGDKHISLSVGATFYHGENRVTFDKLYYRADLAAYKSKEQADNSYTFYDDVL